MSGAFLVGFGLLLLTNNLGEVSGAIQELMQDAGLGRLANI